MTKTESKTDYLVVGAGIAGLVAAYSLSEFGKVLVITKGKLKQSNTYWAQGGIAAVTDKEDSFESHAEDTTIAGAGHCNGFAVKYLVAHAPKAINFLKSIGVEFQEDPVLEAGHSFPRVLRTSDYTGQDILNHLIKAVKKKKNITVQEDTEAIELIEYSGKCYGAFVRHEENEEITPIFAKNTILATGGCGQLYEKTTNTTGSGGDGLALAANVGLELKDIEFIQFHPTALDKPDNNRYFLLSEALRGFGARIVNERGESFLQKFDKRAELAPRDLVSRAVYFELMNGPVYLDMRHNEASNIKKHFPNIYKRVKEYGFDLGKDLVPIIPVAHYACGGIPVDLTGATKLPGLFAVGEVACTGVHGANRLASNSLLEAVVFSQAAASALGGNLESEQAELIDTTIPLDIPKIVIEPMDQVMAYSKRLGQIMWKHVGIIRTTEGLEKAKKQIISIPARDYRIQHRQLICYKIIEACQNRPESLGTHYITSELV
ncbi:L-aspartate oxidase [Patescibacteria group bacterium]|nr:L-aspartate oxidase [Patescibacteria group bacterium]